MPGKGQSGVAEWLHPDEAREEGIVMVEVFEDIMSAAVESDALIVQQHDGTLTVIPTRVLLRFVMQPPPPPEEGESNSGSST